MWAITKGSLRAISRSPSAIVFSFAFPFVFILVFGFIGNSGRPTYRVALSEKTDTTNDLFRLLRSSEELKIISFDSEKDLDAELRKGKLAGILDLQATGDSLSPYKVSFSSTSASNDKWPQLKTLLLAKVNELNEMKFPQRQAVARLDFNYTRDIKQIRQYKSIDFILPGMLGFSLLSAGIFGVAFMFFSLRNTLVLKRFFATPISRTGIVMGECLSRVIFQLFTAVVIILSGYFFFGFTLIHGISTFLQMMALSFIGLVIFMGCGFIVSGVARNESSIPPVANIFTLPQFLLGGTFFSADAFPKWLQPVSKALPLTHFNNALRSIAFEGQNLWDIRMEIIVLLLWGVVVYAVAIKVFRWE